MLDLDFVLYDTKLRNNWQQTNLVPFPGACVREEKVFWPWLIGYHGMKTKEKCATRCMPFNKDGN
ncbi:hypothetical protein BgiBS90_020008 [Biomphalaria glabrata]|nr:hypothetical protein BgiBS90_020008 [Biomphalaria glabrata]